jgi:hypothetical protein
VRKDRRLIAVQKKKSTKEDPDEDEDVGQARKGGKQLYVRRLGLVKCD